MKTYSVFAKIAGIWHQIAETQATSINAAIRQTINLMDSRGNSLPAGTEYRAERLR